jgi:hypothetical protein
MNKTYTIPLCGPLRPLRLRGKFLPLICPNSRGLRSKQYIILEILQFLFSLRYREFLRGVYGI